jgi:ubiquinone/menaquinone biosynthesis C-methylase UbiE
LTVESPHDSNWSDTLFIKYPQLFLPLLEQRKNDATEEVKQLSLIFERFNKKKGSRILDLSCGIGRHTIQLAKKGYEVIGYDNSSFFLDIAEKEAVKGKHNFSRTPKFIHGKAGNASYVLSKHNETNFDMIISMWQSFGYRDVNDDIRMFKDVAKIASPGCLLIIEAQSRDWTIRNFERFNIHDFERSVIHESWNFNFEKSIFENISNFYEKNVLNGDLKLVLKLPTTMQLYSLHDLIDLVNKAGWKYITNYGSLRSLDPINLESQYIITVNQLK